MPTCPAEPTEARPRLTSHLLCRPLQVRQLAGAKKAPLVLPSLPGTPRLHDSRYNLTGRCGSLLYMAPEVGLLDQLPARQATPVAEPLQAL